MRLRSFTQGTAAKHGDLSTFRRDKRALLGAILVSSGALSDAQADQIAAHQEATGMLFGDAAVALGMIGPEAIDRALAHQHDFKLLDPGDTRVSPAVVAAYNVLDPLVEKLRALRSTLFNAPEQMVNPPNIIVVAGLGNNDTPGIAANLAVVFAQLGYEGLLVDANFAAPTLHTLFASSNREGVTSFLVSGGAEPPKIIDTAVPYLDFLPAGPAIPNAVETVERAPLCASLRTVRRGHQFIIVDAGSQPNEVLSAIAGGSDGIVLVVERNRTMLKTVKKAIAHLEDRQLNVVGTILAR